MMVSSVTFVGAHADDAEIWAGGVLASAANATIVLPRSSAVRSAEAEAGARILGARCVLLDDLAELGAVLRKLKPEVLITHWFDDSHQEHRTVADAVERHIPNLKIDTGFPERLYCCDTYNSRGRTGSFAPTHAIDIEPFLERKLLAIGEHRSQPVQQYLDMVTRMSRAWAGRYGLSNAEVFMELPILGILSACHSL